MEIFYFLISGRGDLEKEETILSIIPFGIIWGGN
jgi:hypothetical protein